MGMEQKLAIGMLICAVAIFIGIFNHSWATWKEGGNESGGIGPNGAEFCEGRVGVCLPVSWKELERADLPGDLPILATLTMLLGIASGVGAGAAGALVFLKMTYRIPVKWIRIALGLTAGIGAFFEVRLIMSDRDIQLGPSWGVFVAMGALVAAGVILQKLAGFVANAPRPAAAQLPGAGATAGLPMNVHAPHAPQQPPQQAQPPAQAHPTYPCPRCQRPLVFVAQYQRWFCESCKQYA